MAISRGLLGAGSGSLDSDGMYRQSSYSVMDEVVSCPVNKAQSCPASRDFGGVTGFLQ